eukprot:139454-Rhodomonas_salina.1
MSRTAQAQSNAVSTRPDECVRGNAAGCVMSILGMMSWGRKWKVARHAASVLEIAYRVQRR